VVMALPKGSDAPTLIGVLPHVFEAALRREIPACRRPDLLVSDGAADLCVERLDRVPFYCQELVVLIGRELGAVRDQPNAQQPLRETIKDILVADEVDVFEWSECTGRPVVQIAGVATHSSTPQVVEVRQERGTCVGELPKDVIATSGPHLRSFREPPARRQRHAASHDARNEDRYPDIHARRVLA
jgi:hypothetical protein